MFTQLRALCAALINRVDEATLEPIVKEYHDVMAKLEGRIMALEAKLGVAPKASPPAATPTVVKAAE